MSQSEEKNEVENNLPPPPEDLPEDDATLEDRVPTPNVIYRSSWGAREPKRGLQELSFPVSDVLITFTGTQECLTSNECLDLVHNIQRQHMYDKKLPDIQYNFLIGGDATVYEGRGLRYHADKDPDHMDLKGKSIDIAYIGDFSDSVPLKKVVRAAAGLIQMFVENNFVTREFELTPLSSSHPDYDKETEYCRGPSCVAQDTEEVKWHKFPGFKSLDEILSKALF